MPRALGLVSLACFACFACVAPAPEPGPDPATRSFVPPSPLGCAAATAYDLCFAFDGATPVEVDVALPAAPPAGAVGRVRFETLEGAPRLVIGDVAFASPDKRDLRLYFQVFPATYRVTLAIDLDGDGTPDGPGDALGTIGSVTIGASPLATELDAR